MFGVCLVCVEGGQAQTLGSLHASTSPLSPPFLHHTGASICRHLQAAPFWAATASLGAYLAAPRLREVSVDAAVAAALARGAPAVFLPAVHPCAPASMALLHVDGVRDGVDVAAVPPFGIREPTPTYPPTHATSASLPRKDALATGLDVLIVPGAAFDAGGGRLGRGGGYYDSFAAAARAAHPPGPLLVGVAFNQQVVDAVPVEPHDVRVDVLVTAGGCVGVSERGRNAL